MFNINLFLKQHNITLSEFIDKIKFVMELAIYITDENHSKIQNTRYCYRWLLQELSSFASYKMKNPTNQQRKDAIDITEKIYDKTESNEQSRRNVKIVAEYLKAKLP